MRDQKGFTFWSLSLTIVCAVFFLILGMKLVPSYIEYFTIKKALTTLKSNGSLKTMSKADIQTSFNHARLIDNIKSVTADDLEIGKDDAGNTTVSVEYQVKVPMVANITALLDFAASTDEAAGAKTE